MKCPHCEYEYQDAHYNYEGTYLFPASGEEGKFYRLDAPMKRHVKDSSAQEFAYIYACPSCMKTFVEAV